jgi:hypothetical protein
MRKLILALVALVAMACGASDSQILAIKTAHYRGDKDAMFAAMQQAFLDKGHKIHSAEPATLTVKSQVHWFSYEGESLMAEADEGDIRNLRDRSLSIILVAQLVPSNDAWAVEIHSLYQRYYKGRPNTDVLREDDPSIQGWAHEKADALAVAIHDALKQYEVQTVPAQPGAAPGAAPPAPAPAPAPPPAPDPAPAPSGGY